MPVARTKNQLEKETQKWKEITSEHIEYYQIERHEIQELIQAKQERQAKRLEEE